MTHFISDAVVSYLKPERKTIIGLWMGVKYGSSSGIYIGLTVTIINLHDMVSFTSNPGKGYVMVRPF